MSYRWPVINFTKEQCARGPPPVSVGNHEGCALLSTVGVPVLQLQEEVIKQVVQKSKEKQIMNGRSVS